MAIFDTGVDPGKALECALGGPDICQHPASLLTVPIADLGPGIWHRNVLSQFLLLLDSYYIAAGRHL